MPLVTPIEICRQLGVTRSALTQWSHAADFPKRKPSGKYDVAEVVGWRTKQNQIDQRSHRFSEGKAALQLKHLQLKCDHVQFELDKDKRRFVSIAEVRSELTRCIMACKSRLLSVPGKLAPMIGGLSAADAEKVLRQEVHNALKELSETEWKEE